MLCNMNDMLKNSSRWKQRLDNLDCVLEHKQENGVVLYETSV